MIKSWSSANFNDARRRLNEYMNAVFAFSPSSLILVVKSFKEKPEREALRKQQTKRYAGYKGL